MSNQDKINAILDAYHKFEESAGAVREATKIAFPMGSVVAVTLGGHRIIGTVSGYRGFGTFAQEAA